MFEFAIGTKGAALRVLHWHYAAGINELGKILGVSVKFPNLKELKVSSTGTNNNFNVSGICHLLILIDEEKFIQIPVLVLDLDISTYANGKFAARPFRVTN
jgi:hypothetical protein